MGLFKSKTPKLEPASRMPDPQDPALISARRRKQTEMQQRTGRSSTILSDNLMGSAGSLGA